VPGTTIVAIRSVRQERVVPPRRAQHPVQSPDQVGEVHPVAHHGTDAAGVRERPDQHVGRLTPRRLPQLEPVELQLLARLMLELDRQPVDAALADRTGRPQLEPAQLARQRLIGALETEWTQLPQQHGRIQMRILAEATLNVGAKRLEHARSPRPPPLLPRSQPGADRLAITAGVARDRAHRPAPPTQRHNLHHILPRQQDPRPSSTSTPIPATTLQRAPDSATAAPLLRLAYGSATKQGGETRSPDLGNSDEHIRGVWSERGHVPEENDANRVNSPSPKRLMVRSNESRLTYGRTRRLQKPRIRSNGTPSSKSRAGDRAALNDGLAEGRLHQLAAVEVELAVHEKGRMSSNRSCE
jgi:hypothetical protein